MNASERFLKYVKIHTAADDEAAKVPSSERQFDLAYPLADELKELGFVNVRVTDNCFVYGELPATKGLEELPCMGLIAHLDTVPEFSGENVKPQIIKDYDGGDVQLKGSGDVLSPELFPKLKSLKGKTLITTDGTTLLGADDKAGIAEIITACERVIERGVPHCAIAVAFTPDEEIGMGVGEFDVQGFGASFAYTVDGGELGDINYENFNAAAATVSFKGVSVHPGGSKDTMINASLLAMEFNSLLPNTETPRDTENREGFFHLTDMTGGVETAQLKYIVRDHDMQRFEARKEQLLHIAAVMNARWGEGSVTVKLREQYRNMIEMVKPEFWIVENAIAAMREVGMEPKESPIRGGTDGARLSFMGLPCPNLCTGGYGCHGRFEHIAAEDLEAVSEMLVALVRVCSKKS